ncbi:MAG: hypothetical protein Q4C60_07895 [Eubacteriales bacterium]|nr:hypothetical protein [Eubacteriales bacterium]
MSGMTLRALLENGLIKDKDTITIAKPLTGNACDMRKGKWFNDSILEYLNAEIRELSWDENNGYSIALK